ncbi:MAG: BamA/TamA family outer membrane protein [Bdellovibrionaceae bacterium]|nr:BamA/TamA family outer membrane protein [Pseudobdellovibrionaceae bacterium]
MNTKLISNKIALIAALLLFNSAEAKVKFEFKHMSSYWVKTLNKKFPSLKKHTISPRTSDKIVKFLMQTKKFETASVEFKDNTYIVFAEPIKLISQISFQGNSNVNSNDLMNISRINIGEKLDKEKLLEVGDRLTKHYQKKGFLNAVINASIQETNPQRITITFKIIEKKQCSIKEIIYETTNTQLKNTLLSKFNSYIGKTLTFNNQKDLYEEINQHLLTNRFLSAIITNPEIAFNGKKTQAYLKFTIKDPIKYEVILDGNKDILTLELYRRLQLSDVDRKVTDPSITIVNKLRNIYLDQGYANVQISYLESKNSDKLKKWLKINIKEGPKVRFSNLILKGNFSKSDSYYFKILKSFNVPLLKSGIYNKRELDLAFKELIYYLKSEGYLSAKVIASKAEFIRNKSSVNVHLSIDEGPLTQTKYINFSGIKDFSAEQLLAIMPLKINEAFKVKNLDYTLELIQNFYTSKGYLDIKILNKSGNLVSYINNNTQAKIHFKIHEGPKVFVENVFYEGNSFTKDYVISNEIDINRGDLLTPELIKQIKLRLHALGIFSYVDLKTVEENSSVARRTLIISVTEKDPGTFKTGIGFHTRLQGTMRGFMGLSYNNLSGTARALSGRVELSNHFEIFDYITHKASIGYLEPFLFNTRTRGRIILTQLRKLTDLTTVDGVDRATVNDSSKAAILLERNITNDLKFIWNFWSMDFRKAFHYIDKAENLDDLSTQQIVTIGPNLDYDKRDNQFLPTKGYYSRWGLEYSSPDIGSSEKIHFYKTDFLYTHYLRLLGPKVIWANSIQGGYLENLSNIQGSGVPDSHAFFLGGHFTLRGFYFSERIPKSSELDPDGKEQLVIQNNSNYHLFKTELRFPLYGNFNGFIFYDAGAVIVTGIDQSKPFRQSAGFGIHYNTPVGPLNLQFGFKLDPQSDFNEDTQRIHLSFGSF